MISEWSRRAARVRRALADLPPRLGVLLLWLLVTVFALAGGWSLMFYASWVLLLLLGVCYLLAILGVGSLHFSRDTRALRAEVASYFDERILVENTSWIPKLWLEIQDEGEHPEHAASFVVSLGPYGRFVRPVHTLCRQRGAFQLGPMFAESADPFGLFRRRRQIGESSTLLVYPVARDLPRFGQLPGELSGGPLQGERVQFTTPNVSGVREYRAGDTVNRIHWPTTARQGRLMVKEFERDPSADVWLILDLDARHVVGQGPESTEEYAVTACASLAKYLLGEDRSVGIITQARVLTADRGTRQLLRTLEMLAYVRSDSTRSLAELLIAEQQRFRRTDHLVVITSTAEEGWARIVRTLDSRGVRTSAVLIDGESFGDGASPLPVLGALAGARVPTYIVKQGLPLEHALAAPTAGARPAAV